MTPLLWQKAKKNQRASWWKWKRNEKPGLKLNIQKTKIMAPGPITSWHIDGETVETATEFLFGGLQNHCRWWLQPWNSKLLAPLKKSYDQSAVAAAAKSLQSCPTLCDPTDGSPPGSPVPGILQARTLEWVAISFSNAWKWKVKVKSLSCVRFLATTWTAAHSLLHPWDFPGKSTGVGCKLHFPWVATKNSIHLK